MGLEIERKFLVDPSIIKNLPEGSLVKQGYIKTADLTTVRARIRGSRGYITIKGASSENGLSRSEFEYEIPLSDARNIIDTLCGNRIIEKTRHIVRHGNHDWEVDVYHGSNKGLIIAEVELSETGEAVVIPNWVLKEVTGDIRYYNSRLSESPWPAWKDSNSGNS